MPTARSSPTIRDVARLANVSVSTVSNALSGRKFVSPEVEQRVREAAANLKYRPDMAAHSLRTGVRHAIGLVIPDITNPFFADVSRGVEDAAHDAGWGVFVGNTDLDDLRQAELLRRLSSAADGLIVFPTTTDTAPLVLLTEVGIPLVIGDERISVPGAGGVFSDNWEGGRLVALHLASRGARRCAMLSGPPNLPTAKERLRGFEAGLAEVGLSLPERLVVNGPYTIEAGDMCCRQLLASDPDIDALFAADDMMAIGALDALHDLGRRVPDDVLLCGFDGISWASRLQPPLSTVAQQSRRLGEEAARLLLEMFQGSGRQREIVLSVSLEERASTQRKS